MFGLFESGRFTQVLLFLLIIILHINLLVTLLFLPMITTIKNQKPSSCGDDSWRSANNFQEIIVVEFI